MSTKQTLEILAAEPQLVTVPQLGQVNVAELSALDLEAFLLKFSEAAAVVLGGTKGAAPSVSAAGFTVSLDLIGELIRNSAALSIDLVSRATGKTTEEIGKLPARVLLTLVGVALEVNLTEDFFAAGKGVAGQLARLFPAAQTGSATSSKPSVPPATPSAT